MSPNEFLGNVLLLIVAENDTTRNSMSGGISTNKYPEQLAKVQSDQSLIPSMVSEIIRWQSPVAHMPNSYGRC